MPRRSSGVGRSHPHVVKTRNVLLPLEEVWIGGGGGGTNRALQHSTRIQQESLLSLITLGVS